MYLQLINFNLKDLSFADYEELCSTISGQFASVAGLTAKFWLSDVNNNVFGGVYIWESKTSMEEFKNSELFGAVASHPNLINISSRGFDVLDGPTRITRGFYLEDYLERIKVLETCHNNVD